MSVDEQAEEELYNAVQRANKMLKSWPQQKTRIFKNVIRALMIAINVTEVKLEEDGHEKKDNR